MFTPIIAEIKAGAFFEAKDGTQGQIHNVRFDLINRDIVIFDITDSEGKERGSYFGELVRLYRDFNRLGDIVFPEAETKPFFDCLMRPIED